MKLNKNSDTSEIEREIEIMSLIDHPSVLSLTSFSVGKGKLVCDRKSVATDVTYFVMPLAGKGDLGSYLWQPDSHFSEKMSAFFFKQIVDGVDAIHKWGFVHLDLKPENILITKYLEARIADFGLSASIEGEDGRGIFVEWRVGSKPYWSPELYNGFEYDGAQADLYAVGIILFIMIFGCRPFQTAENDNPLFSILMRNPYQFWKSHPVTARRIEDRTVS